MHTRRKQRENPFTDISIIIHSRFQNERTYNYYPKGNDVECNFDVCLMFGLIRLQMSLLHIVHY